MLGDQRMRPVGSDMQKDWDVQVYYICANGVYEVRNLEDGSIIKTIYFSSQAQFR